MIQKIFLFIASFFIFILLSPILLIMVIFAWFKGRQIRHLWKDFEKQAHFNPKKSLDENIIDVEYEEVA